MSLSTSDNNGSYSRVPPTGKTPPPAPSAAYAKRYFIYSSLACLTLTQLSARELQAEQRYRPPALRAMASAGSPSDESASSATTPVDSVSSSAANYPPGFRRARAGTLPSNVHLAAQQRFAAASNTLGTPAPSTDSLVERQVSTPTSTLAPSRPNLRHSASVATSVAGRETNSRLRSESLTLPPGGLSNAFGPSIFSSSWLSSNGSNNGFSVLDELRSESGADDFDVHTLDYLGLDDSHRPPPAATLSELRTQAQAALAGNLAGNPSRLRASTVSNPYRTRPSVTNSLLPTPISAEEEEYMETYDDSSYNLNSYDSPTLDNTYSSYIAKGFKQTDLLTAATRPRAISVGNLDDPMRSIQRRATIDAHSYVNELTHQTSGLSALASNINVPSGALKTDKLATTRNVHFPNGEVAMSRAAAYLLAPGAPNRSVSPKSEGPSSQTQTPTRSLWIGNLDSAVTSEQLIRVFAPYGAIESLRLLPEKVCSS